MTVKFRLILENSEIAISSQSFETSFIRKDEMKTRCIRYGYHTDRWIYKVDDDASELPNMTREAQ